MGGRSSKNRQAKIAYLFFYAIRTNSDEKEQRIPSHLLMRG